MPILSDIEIMEALDYTVIDDVPGKVNNIIYPGVEAHIKEATGKDWGETTEIYNVIDPLAKMVASILLVRWFEDPGQIGKINDVAVLSMINQLEAKVLQEKQAEDDD
ncbi:MAG: hypothetical protein ACOCRO_02695 [Halanaerobiales bacterium]